MVGSQAPTQPGTGPVQREADLAVTMAKKSRKHAASSQATQAPGAAARRLAAPPGAPALVMLGVTLLTLLVYAPLFHAGFVNWDDGLYVLENRFIRTLTGDSILTMFLAGVHPGYPNGIAYNYHPLTILSLALEFQVAALKPGLYHAVNLALHVLNAWLVYLVARRLLADASPYVAVGIAAVFAVHPLHVESVAWISERKDVLLTAFYLGAMFLYWGYLRTRRGRDLVCVGLLFLAALLSKPSAVTFPVTMLLLDYVARRPWDLSALAEKVPFFILSLAFGLVTLHVQIDVAIGDPGRYTLVQRLLFATYGLFFYVYSLLLPWHPAAFYPYPNPHDLPLVVVLAPFVVVALLVAYWRWGRSHRGVGFGLAFFFINVILTLQLFQLGSAVVSDRYTYLSYVGLLVAAGCILDRRVLRPGMSATARRVLPAAAGVWLAYLSVLSFHQVGTWRDSDSLWTNVIARFRQSALAYNNRGNYWLEQGRLDRAEADLNESVALNPNGFDGRVSRGALLRLQKKFELALADLGRAIELKPDNPKGYVNRGNTYFDLGRLDEALRDYERALALDPGLANAQSNIGSIRFRQGRNAEAVAAFDKALQIDPYMGDARLNRGATRLVEKAYDGAVADLTRYLETVGPNAKAYYYRALAYQGVSRHAEAIRDFDAAIRLDGAKPLYVQKRKESVDALR